MVFVGFTAPGLFDLKPTPVSSVTPGMSVHATLLANLLHRDFRVRISPRLALGLALVLALAMSVTVLLVPGLWQLALLLLAYGGALAFLVFISFRNNLWMDGVLLASSLGLSFAVSTVFSYATEGRQKRQIKQAFSHYMSDLLIQDVLKHPEKLRLGGEKRVLTVFFSDLAGFTSMSEKLTPEEVVTLLNRYLTAMTDIILASGGIIDKYEGDAIMAFWGAPLPQEDHAARGCLAALENQARLAELREEFIRTGLPPVFARIGLNTGEMIIGNLGSSQRFDFTVIGDSVNLASRLEGAGKEYGTAILISEETYRQAQAAVEVRELDLLQVKGKQLPVRIYELIAKKGGLDPGQERICELFAEGLSLYRKQEWDEAVRRFQQVLELKPEDGPAKTFIRRCQSYKGNPPGPGWDGVYRLTTK
jgi:adenylate cyclase